MFRFGKMSDTGVRQEFVERFGGLCHRERSADGTGTTRKNGALQFYDEKNLSARDFPALSTREKRKTINSQVDQIVVPAGKPPVHYPGIPKGGILAKDKLWWLYSYADSETFGSVRNHLGITDGKMYAPIGLLNIPSMQEKQMVSMGAYILIWPDKKWINTAKESGVEVGDGDTWSADEDTGTYIAYLHLTLHDADRHQIYPTVTAYGASAPDNPSDGDYWLEKGATTSDTPTLKRWDASTEEWADPGTTYICFEEHISNRDLKAGDIVRLQNVSLGDNDFLNNVSLKVANQVQNDALWLYGVCIPYTKTYASSWGFDITKRLQAPESGMMEKSWYATNTSVVLCRESGDAYTGVTVSPTAPAEPTDKALWMDTGGDTLILKEWSAAQEMWVEIPTTYLKISSQYVGAGFSVGDGVQITGFSDSALDGSYVLRAVGDNYIVVDGIITSDMSGETVTVARTVPDMDFVLESNNRIWGCKYGTVNGQLVNEIYASKLGDFKNWNVFDGLSTDSYAASRGSDGPWTGAIEYGGMPVFFKEDYIEKVYPSASGAHRIVTTRARGVQRGSHRSLAIVNEALFYKATDGVMVYDGSLPALISEDLGDTPLYEAAGAGAGGIYYCSMRDSSENWRLYTYDINKGIWHMEDGTHGETFASFGGDVYFVTASSRIGYSHSLLCSRGGTEAVDWMAETGAIGYHDANQKYLSRFLLRMKTEGSVKLYIRYDEGEWLHRDTVYMGGSTKTITMPVPPRRCDHVYLRLIGDADMKLYGMTRYYERGSDMAW